jgi:hypothetical protein
MSSPFPNNPFPSGNQPPNPFGPPQPSFGPPPSSPSPSGFPTGTPGQPFPAYPGPTSRLSLLAVLSMIFGAGGLFTCCCAFLAIPSSLLAIGTGHAALVFINRSGSQLTGKVPAAVGLVAGYMALLISGGILIAGWVRPDKPADNVAQLPHVTTADDLLNDVENKIRTDSGGIAHGNTEEAKALAQEYSEFIQLLRDELFTKGDGGISLSGDKFITYCELRPGQCAFVVHVPDYRNFEGDAKKSLAELAWLAAQKTVADDLEPGDKLAVGMKGVILYGAVMIGKVSDEEGEKAGLDMEGERVHLLKFFEPEEEPEEGLNVEMPGAIELPPTESPPASEDSKPATESEPPASPPAESPPAEPNSTTESPPAESQP